MLKSGRPIRVQYIYLYISLPGRAEITNRTTTTTYRKKKDICDKRISRILASPGKILYPPLNFFPLFYTPLYLDDLEICTNTRKVSTKAQRSDITANSVITHLLPIIVSSNIKKSSIISSSTRFELPK